MKSGNGFRIRASGRLLSLKPLSFEYALLVLQSKLWLRLACSNRYFFGLFAFDTETTSSPKPRLPAVMNAVFGYMPSLRKTRVLRRGLMLNSSARMMDCLGIRLKVV
ncbi:MAG: hypothetical protein FWF95_05475 [Syntrophorhabdaceae bacterium]|nr:hypothetical protein [Syntrophorhabdaceae bacterium]